MRPRAVAFVVLGLLILGLAFSFYLAVAMLLLGLLTYISIGDGRR